jgi:molecular chaperone DnaJ
MIVTVDVIVPDSLSGKAKNAVEDLRSATAGADPREELLELAKEK